MLLVKLDIAKVLLFESPLTVPKVTLGVVLQVKLPTFCAFAVKVIGVELLGVLFTVNPTAYESDVNSKYVAGLPLNDTE